MQVSMRVPNVGGWAAITPPTAIRPAMAPRRIVMLFFIVKGERNE
jgi:hypothetical protein